MKRVLLVTIVLAVAAAPLRPLSAAGGEEFTVIVHPASTVTTIARDELSKIFLKRLRTWEDGSRAVPVNQLPESPAREAFSRQVHDRSVINIEVYWKR